MISLIIPYYRAPKMLAIQLATWMTYPVDVYNKFEFIVIDDGSPEPAIQIVKALQKFGHVMPERLSVYRILEDIPWNRNGARNLGSTVSKCDWLMHMDIDHTLPLDQARLMPWPVNRDYWYRFRRFRIGSADETRKKDSIKPDAKFGEIKPHIDSYLVPKDIYWATGGYDEDYRGFLGGGSPFLKRLEEHHPVRVLDCALHVHTRDSCIDASVSTLSRDTGEYTRVRTEKERTGNTRPKNPLRFKWEKVF